MEDGEGDGSIIMIGGISGALHLDGEGVRGSKRRTKRSKRGGKGGNLFGRLQEDYIYIYIYA